jgi:hypothetical protein
MTSASVTKTPKWNSIMPSETWMCSATVALSSSGSTKRVHCEPRARAYDASARAATAPPATAGSTAVLITAANDHGHGGRHQRQQQQQQIGLPADRLRIQRHFRLAARLYPCRTAAGLLPNFNTIHMTTAPEGADLRSPARRPTASTSRGSCQIV